MLLAGSPPFLTSSNHSNMLLPHLKYLHNPQNTINGSRFLVYCASNINGSGLGPEEGSNPVASKLQSLLVSQLLPSAVN
jgi:hypothetical protein